jgi:putative hydrolase of HD superfamily
MADDHIADITRFAYEIGLLKRYPRTGWFVLGVPDPESIADHCFRASLLASLIAAMEGADPERAAFLAMWHDSQETRITDLPHLTKPYVTKMSNESVTAAQVGSLPAPMAAMIRGAVGEYEADETLEAKCAHDADKLECLLQAREYGDQGYRNVKPWIDSSMENLRTISAKQLADEALSQASFEWLEEAKCRPPRWPGRLAAAQRTVSSSRETRAKAWSAEVTMRVPGSLLNQVRCRLV